jgi:hypothetical protein
MPPAIAGQLRQQEKVGLQLLVGPAAWLAHGGLQVHLPAEALLPATHTVDAEVLFLRRNL